MLRFRADCHSSFAVLSDTVLLDDVIHILIASAGEVDEHRTLAHRLCELHAVGDRVGAFDRRDDALHSGKLEEGVERLIVVVLAVEQQAGAAGSNKSVQFMSSKSCLMSISKASANLPMVSRSGVLSIVRHSRSRT